MENQKAIISGQTVIRGEVNGEDELSIFGRVEGKVNINGTLFIESGAVIKAELKIVHAVISGIVIGDIYASDCVEITPEGKVLGNIFTPRLVLAEGGAIKGRVAMKESVPQESHMRADKTWGQKPSGESYKYGLAQERRIQSQSKGYGQQGKTIPSKGFKTHTETHKKSVSVSASESGGQTSRLSNKSEESEVTPALTVVSSSEINQDQEK